MLGKFEKKVDELKNKIDRKWLDVAAFVVFTAVTFFAVEMTNNYKRQKNQVQDEYNKSMYEMVGYIQNVEYELAKLQVSSTKDFVSQSLADIWRESNLAKANLEALPIEQNSMANSSKFLSQVSDFSYSLMKKSIAGQLPTDEEREQINTIYEEASILSDVMNEVYEDLNDGRIKWDELAKVGNEKLENSAVESVSSITKISKSFQEYEGLIYDGAFSDHILNSSPKYIENDEECSVQDAQNLIESIYDSSKIESIEESEESNGKIDLYNFNIKLKGQENTRSISITKKGCKMYSMISDRKIDESRLSIDFAKQKGREYLKLIGYEDLKDTYYLTMENFAIINYTAIQDGITLYPDLIKIKIALDTGEILSLEAEGYIFNHVYRENLDAKITLDDAKSILNSKIEPISSQMAIIPTDSKGEVLTYEFKGKVNEREYLIYINANEKKEEKILIIMDTPGGILTM